MNRRKALKILAGAVPLATGLYTWQFEPHWLDITHNALPITGLNAQLHGTTLAQLSDLHIGPSVDDGYIQKCFQRVTDLAPDFVVITGDWITYRAVRQFEQLKRNLEHLPHGKLGTIGILGNHDYGPNWSMDAVANRVADIAGNAGVTILRNQAISIAGLQFVGFDDLWGPHFASRDFLAPYAAAPSTIALCHNPDGADLPVWSNYSRWILAGHTHGGQCKPPFLPPPIVPVKNKNYTSGHIQLSGGRNMYISRGVGHLLKVRFNSRPEIPIFHFARS
jgi:predicted MPP superfamily phosphohydrolase